MIRNSWGLRLVGPGMLLAACLGCSGGIQDPELPESVTAAMTAPLPESAAAAKEPEEGSEAPEAAVELEGPESAGPAAPPASIYEAAEAAKALRQEVGPAEIVITDRNLGEYATGELTLAEVSDGAIEGDGANEAEMPLTEGTELYWRNRVRELRVRWRRAVDRIPVLESEAAELRQRFYAEDDPFYRDTQIKPAWDRALDELARSRSEVGAAQRELQQALEEGRRQGALPGWLREGIELEPEASPAGAESPEHQVSEPEILEQEGDR